MSDDARKFGAQGGKKRAAGLTKQQLSAAARQAALARWGKDLPVAEYNGVLEIGDLKFPCAVLSDGTRVLTETEFMKAMQMYRSGALSVRRERGGAQEPLYLAFKNLKPFVDKHLNDVHTQSLPFRTLTGNVAHGIRAEIIVHVCNVWIDAREAGVLGSRQLLVAEKAELLKNALAIHAIEKLVDEVTGFQASSDQQAIAQFLRMYVRKELQQWVQTFPRSFFEQLCRLKGISLAQENMRMPQYMGNVVNELVYSRIAPGVLSELKTVNPVVGPKGRRKAKHHQFMTKEVGNPKLQNLIGRLEGIAYAFPDGAYDAYKTAVDRLIPNYGTLPLWSAADIPARIEQATTKLLSASSE
jgi:P63C domain